jgi:hypothetical protein
MLKSPLQKSMQKLMSFQMICTLILEDIFAIYPMGPSFNESSMECSGDVEAEYLDVL